MKPELYVAKIGGDVLTIKIGKTHNDGYIVNCNLSIYPPLEISKCSVFMELEDLFPLLQQTITEIFTKEGGAP